MLRSYVRFSARWHDTTKMDESVIEKRPMELTFFAL